MTTAVFSQEPIRRSNKDFNSGLANHSVQSQELYMESEPSALHRLFVLSAIVVFIGIGFSSIPNVLSARHPRDESIRASRRSEVTAGVGDIGLTYRQAQYSPQTDSLSRIKADNVPVVRMGDKDEDYSSMDESLINLQRGILKTEVGNDNIVINPKSEQLGSNSKHQTREKEVWIASSAQSQPLPSKATRSLLTPQSDQTQEQNQWRTPTVEQAKVWSLIQAWARLSIRVVVWVVKVLYLAIAFVIGKPVGVAVAVAEKPYVITRDICKAFLPVYSFFSVAAVIGIAIGGIALWIAQLLIGVIGADQEKEEQSVVLVQPKVALYNRSSKTERMAGVRSRSLTDTGSPLSTENLGWGAGAETTRFRSKSNPGIPLAPNSHRRREFIAGVEEGEDGEDEYDDDDDD
ncbi:hypothetical protein BGZ46_008000 [Entomortierella lignicola]|nr:hypothetical protein BGZ46_008000 [Entomortierella lignicola]